MAHGLIGSSLALRNLRGLALVADRTSVSAPRHSRSRTGISSHSCSVFLDAVGAADWSCLRAHVSRYYDTATSDQLSVMLHAGRPSARLAGVAPCSLAAQAARAVPRQRGVEGVGRVRDRPPRRQRGVATVRLHWREAAVALAGWQPREAAADRSAGWLRNGVQDHAGEHGVHQRLAAERPRV